MGCLNDRSRIATFFEKLTVICCIHHPTHPMSKIPLPILNFLDSDVCSVMTMIFLTNLKKYARIPFTLTFHPRNNPVKAIILNNFKILQNNPGTGAIFSQPPLISFKRDKNVGNFLVRSAFKTIEKPGTFKCARSRCKTCPFVQNADKISGPKRSVKIIIIKTIYIIIRVTFPESFALENFQC